MLMEAVMPCTRQVAVLAFVIACWLLWRRYGRHWRTRRTLAAGAKGTPAS